MTNEIRKMHYDVIVAPILVFAACFVIFFINSQNKVVAILAEVVVICSPFMWRLLDMQFVMRKSLESASEIAKCKEELIRCFLTFLVCCILFSMAHNKFFNSDGYIQQVKEVLGVSYKLELLMPDASMEEDLCEKVRIDAVEQLHCVRDLGTALRAYPVAEDTEFRQLSDLCAKLNSIMQKFNPNDMTDAEITMSVLKAVDEIERWEYTAAYKGVRVQEITMELTVIMAYMLLCSSKLLKLIFSARKLKTDVVSVK